MWKIRRKETIKRYPHPKWVNVHVKVDVDKEGEELDSFLRKAQITYEDFLSHLMEHLPEQVRGQVREAVEKYKASWENHRRDTHLAGCEFTDIIISHLTYNNPPSHGVAAVNDFATAARQAWRGLQERYIVDFEDSFQV